MKKKSKKILLFRSVEGTTTKLAPQSVWSIFSGKEIKLHCRVCPSLILHLIPYHHILPRYHPYSDYATIPIFFARKHNEAAYFSIVHYYYYSYIHHYCSISRYYYLPSLPKNSTIILNPLFLLSTISVVKINNYYYLSIYYTYPLFLPY